MKKKFLVSGLTCLLSLCHHAVRAETATLEQITVEETAVAEQSLAAPKETIALDQEPVRPDTLSEALEDVFYVELLKDGSYNAEPYIRGRGTKGVPVYLEGMRLNAGHNDSTNLLSMIDVGSVDVYRGANASTLGMGAMSGAVVARFAEPTFGKTDAFGASGFMNVQSAMFSESGLSTSMGAEVFNNRFSFSLSGGVSDFMGYEDGNGDEVLHSGYEMSNYNGAAAVKVSDDSYAYLRYMKIEADSEDPFSRYQNGGVWLYTDRPNDDGEYYFVGYRDASLGGLKDVDVQLYGNDLHYDVNTNREATPSEMNELYRESETRGGKVSAKKALDDHLLSFSTGYSKMDITNGLRKFNMATKTWGDWTNAYGISGGDISSYALNAADDFTYDKAFFNLSGGYEHVRRNVDSNINTSALAKLVPAALLDQIRQEDTHEDDNLFSAGVIAGYKFCSAFVPYVKLSNATRTPYFNEAYGNNPGNGSQIPNQTLDNETVWGADLGADGKLGAFYYTSALYYQKYSDYIELANTGYKTTAGLPIKQFINLDDAEISGAEAMVGYNLGGDRFVEASYLYTYGENETYDQPLAYIAPQKLTVAVGQRRDLGLNWRIEEVMVDNQDRISKINGEVPTAGYALTNLSISYAFDQWAWAKKTVVAFDLNNVFDREYREHLDRVSSTAWYLPDDPGVNGLLSLRVQF